MLRRKGISFLVYASTVKALPRRKGISIFQFSQLNLNYEYQFSRVVVSNILIILLAGGRAFLLGEATRREGKERKKKRRRDKCEGALHDWEEGRKEEKLNLCIHTHIKQTDVRARSKAHKFPSTLNTHFRYFVPCLQKKIGFLFPSGLIRCDVSLCVCFGCLCRSFANLIYEKRSRIKDGWTC